MNAKVLTQITLRSGGRCEARVECSGRTAVLTHHRKRAGRKDTPANTLRLCSKCHTWIHSNVEASYELGLLVRSSEDPEQIGVMGMPASAKRIPVIRLNSDGIDPVQLAGLFNCRYVGEVA